MTTVIDERVVEMRFNNADFEKNVAQSMDTLDKLKKSLDFDSAKSLEEIGKASKNFSLSGITETIQEATTKFSALEIAGVTAIMNITNRAVDFGVKFAKSLSIDQVTMGFDKYATKTQAVQTIMAATADQFQNQAEQMAYVNEQLDKLTWFTDETSYNMIDMTSNIGKFVSNNVALDKAATAMQGIATWAGLSGASTNEASRAMYNFSQAMGAGAMKLQDWKSIENANMATAKFKQTAIDTAVELGRLKQAADGVVTTLDGKTTVSVTQFSESLKKKWFDADVMTETLGKFGRFADELYALSDATGLTASELLESLDEYKAGTLDLSEIARESTMSLSDLDAKYKELTSDQFALGKKAFEASQEAKTFKEAIDSVKDAVSSGWMNTFEIIFGNYLEAKKLWTGLANNLYDMFAEGGNKRNEVLKVWKELGGRNSLIMGAVNALNLAIKPIEAIKRAFESVLPKGRDFGKVLNQLTHRFYLFTSRIQPSQELLNNLYQFFRGLFSVGKMVLQFFGQLISAITKTLSPARSLIEIIGMVLGKVGTFLQIIAVVVTQSGVISTVVSIISLALEKLVGIIKMLAVALGGGIIAALKVIVPLIQKAVTAIATFVSTAGTKLVGIGNKISASFSKVGGIFNKFNKSGKEATTTVKTLEKAYGSADKQVVKFGTVTRDSAFEVEKSKTLLERFLDVLNKAKTAFITAGAVIGGAFVTLGVKIFKFFTDFKTRFQEATKNAKTAMDYIKAFFTTIGGLFSEGWTKVKEFFAQFDIDLTSLKTAFDTIKDGLDTIITKLGPGRIAAFAFATAILALVGAAIKLSDSFRSMFGAVTGVFNNINKILKKQFAKSSVITDLAKAFAILAGSLALLTFVDQTALENVSKVMLKLMIAFTLCAGALRGLDLLLSKFNIETDFNLINSNILALAGSMTLLTMAFSILNTIDLKGDWLKKLGIMAIMFGEITAAAIALSRFAPQLSKGSFILLSLALSMKLMVDALSTIGEKDIEGVNKNMIGFTALFAGVAAMTAAAGKLKLTSAINLILVAKALQIMLPQIQVMIKEIAPIVSDMAARFEGVAIDFTKLKEAAKLAIDKANDFFNYLYTRFNETNARILMCTSIVSGTLLAIAGLAAVIASGFAIAAIITAIGTLGNLLKGIGIAVIGLALAIRIVTSSIKELGDYFRTLSDVDYQKTLSGFLIISTVLVGALGLVSLLDAVATRLTMNALYEGKAIRTSFLGIAAAFVGIAIAMKVIISALKGLEGIKPERFWSIIGATSMLLVFLGVAAAGAGMITKGGSALLGLIGIAATMAILVAEMGVLSMMWSDENANAMSMALVTMAGLFIGLTVVLNQLTKLKKAGPILALTLPIFGMIITLAGFILVLGSMTNVNYGAIATGLLGIIVILGIVNVMYKKIASMPALGKALKNKIMLLRACVLALVGVTLAIVAVSAASNQFGGANVLSSLIALSALIGVVALMMDYISKMKSLTKADFKKKIELLGACVLALGVVAFAIYQLAKQNIPNVWSSFLALTASMAGLTAVFFAISTMSKAMDLKQVGAACALVISLSIMVGAVAKSLYELAGVDPSKLESATAALNALIVPLGVLSVVLGILQGLLVAVGSYFGSAAGGWAGAVALPLLIASIGTAVAAMGTGLWLGAKGIDMLTGAIERLVPALKSLSELPLADLLVNINGLAGPIAKLGAAFVIFGFGAGASGVAMLILAKALTELNPGLTTFGTNVKTLGEIDLTTVAAGMVKLAVAGTIMGTAAGGVTLFAGALGKLAGALMQYNTANSGGTIIHSGSGSHGTFGYWEGAETAVKTSIENQEELITTHVRKMPEYGAEGVEGYTTGIVSRQGDAQKAQEKVLQLDKSMYKVYENAYASAGYDSITAYYNAINNTAYEKIEQLPTLAQRAGNKLKSSVKGAVIDPVVNETEAAIGTSLDDIGNDISNFFTNGELSGLIGNAGTYLGKLFGGNMAYAAMQIISQMKGSFDWMFSQALVNAQNKSLSQYGANGMPSNIINQMYDAKGLNPYSEMLSKIAKAGKDASNITGWLGDDFKGLTDIASDFTDAINGATEGTEEFSEAAGKAGKGAKELANSLKDTISGQLDMFSKFEMKMGMSADTILENMRSNIDGFASWSHRMTVLAERFVEHGISDTLYKKLSEMGPKGYETMNAIYQMTDEQLDELKTLWETGLTLPEGQADIVAAGYQYMGEMATQGFSDALNDHKAAHEAAHGLGKAALDGLAESLDVHSPSRETFKIGVFLIDGLGLGMTSDSAMAMLELCVGQVSNRVLELFNEGFSKDTMSEAGTGLLASLFDSMLANEDGEDNPILTAFANSLLNFEVLDNAFTAFTEHISELLNTFFEMPDSKSPSMLFFRIAQMCYQGFYDSFIQNIVTIQLAILYYCIMVMTYLNLYNLPGKFYDIGMYAVQGMAQGIIDYIPEAVAAAEQLASAVEDAARVELDINSPSKVFRSIGNSVGEGFVMGIRDGAENVYNAAASLARDGVDGANTGMGRLQDIINEGLDFNPVITPMFDLSLIRSQMNELNALMSNPAYGVGQNGGNNFTGNPEGQTINFTQNNYSPKALSRYEIYRQTKNQLSTIRKVVTG